MIQLEDRVKVDELFSILRNNSRNYRYIKSYTNSLVKENVDLSIQDENGNTLLHQAIKLKDIKLLKLFIDAGINVNLANEMRMAPIHCAISIARLDMVKLLADSGADLESTMELELHYIKQ